MDQWQQHVSLEISEAIGNDERLLEITESIVQMDSADLIPDEVADRLFLMLSIGNTGG